MQQRFLLQILLLAQHVSGTTMPIIRSSQVLYSDCCLWYLVLWFSKLLVWCGAEGYVSVLQDAVVFKLLVWCGAEGYVSNFQDAAVSCKPDT